MSNLPLTDEERRQVQSLLWEYVPTAPKKDRATIYLTLPALLEQDTDIARGWLNSSNPTTALHRFLYGAP